MKRLQVKICGLTSADAVQCCAEEGIGFAGFIAVERSPRYITTTQAKALRAYIGETMQPVLVTVDADDALLDSYMEALQPRLLQLHGKESPEHCLALQQRYGLPIIKAIAVAGAQDIHKAVTMYHDAVDYLLFDTKRTDGGSGGSGKVFDWSALDKTDIPLPWFLSGGLHAGNVSEAVQRTSPPYLDVSSGLESAPGVKDLEKIRHFLRVVDGL